MTMRRLFLAGLLGAAVMSGLAEFQGSLAGQQTAVPAAGVALTGTVRSQEEGPMEGVLVSAKRDGTTITTTVVTNAQGVYSFPRERLEPGQYNVSIRAVGYVMAGPSPKAPVNLAASGAASTAT